jgi:hypothetical protein
MLIRWLRKKSIKEEIKNKPPESIGNQKKKNKVEETREWRRRRKAKAMGLTPEEYKAISEQEKIKKIFGIK